MERSPHFKTGRNDLICGRMGESQLGEAMRQVLIYSDEDGHWVSECPSLPGCISQGQTKEEAITNIKEAINLYISVLEEDGLSVPEERFDALLVVV